MGVAEGDDMGHDYDGIRELNNPLPKWWSYMFWATLVFGLGYLVLYPGLGNFAGVLGWKSSYQNISSVEESRELMAKAQEAQHINQYAMELEAADKVFG